MARAKEKAKRIQCLNNEKQLGLGSLMYAMDNNGALTGCADYASDDDNWLYLYVKNTSSFVCPSTQQFVRTNRTADTLEHIPDAFVDLLDFATSKTGAGYSYENFGFWSKPNSIENGVTVFGTRKTEALVQTRAKTSAVQTGLVPGASRNWLITDADDERASPPAPLNHNDYPDSIDNHGADGANVVMADGHAQWIKQSDWVLAYEISADVGRTTP